MSECFLYKMFSPERKDELLAKCLLYEDASAKIDKLNQQFHDYGNQRTQWDVLKILINTIKIVIDSHLSGQKIFELHGNYNHTTFPPSPLCLMLILFELHDLRQGRTSPLLAGAHKSVRTNNFHFLRQQIEAGGGAGVRFLHAAARPISEITELIAKRLNKAGFLNQRGHAQTPEGVLDWHKGRKKRGRDFEPQYEAWGTRFYSLCDCPGSDARTEPDVETEIVELVAALPDLLSYRITHR